MKEVLEAFAAGEFVLVYDENRECEGDFFVLAEHITPEKVHFLQLVARGMICIACSPEILQKLEIPLMVEANENPHGTNFCVSLDAKSGVTTGVSASDRARAIKILADPQSTRKDFVIPGHTFPLRAETDYTKRFGHTEAALKLAKKTENYPVIVICEILNEVGEKANQEELQKMSKDFEIPMVTLEQLKK